MDLIDPHVHMISRTTDDYEAMAIAGIRAVIEPAFWLGQPRTHPGTFYDYYDMITDWEPKRAANFGIHHYCCIGVNPRESNNVPLAKEVLAELPRFLDRPNVVAVGEIGFDDITDAEEDSIRRQMEIAVEHDLPIMVHTPHINKARGTERTLKIVESLGLDQEKVLIDHNTEETIEMVKSTDCWAGHTVYNITKLSPERAVNIFEEYGTEKMLVNSSSDWGPSDPLNVPRTVHEMRRRGIDDTLIRQLVWKNPIAFFGKSGRLDSSLQ
jgi:hypothetical protein